MDIKNLAKILKKEYKSVEKFNNSLKELLNNNREICNDFDDKSSSELSDEELRVFEVLDEESKILSQLINKKEKKIIDLENILLKEHEKALKDESELKRVEKLCNSEDRQLLIYEIIRDYE